MATAGHLVDKIKINVLTREERSGRAFWFKRRRITAPFVIAVANLFFRVVRNPVVITGNSEEWLRWELTCLELLHGDRFCWMIEKGAFGLEEFPGESLSHHLDRGTATLTMAAAAARELRRAHQLNCPELSGKWSHGDPHTGNFVYHEAEDRARLMDFEVRHESHLSESARHTDDLLVFLQDTLGRMPRERWIEWARVFVDAYGVPEITARLIERLVAPRGVARLWWAVRTTYLAPRELHERLAALRSALAASC